MTDHGDAEDVENQVRARVAAAPRPSAIQDLADREINDIRALAELAAERAREVDVLMQRLSELLDAERGSDGEP
jgi:hypothetical protein